MPTCTSWGSAQALDCALEGSSDGSCQVRSSACSHLALLVQDHASNDPPCGAQAGQHHVQDNATAAHVAGYALHHGTHNVSESVLRKTLTQRMHRTAGNSPGRWTQQAMLPGRPLQQCTGTRTLTIRSSHWVLANTESPEHSLLCSATEAAACTEASADLRIVQHVPRRLWEFHQCYN